VLGIGSLLAVEGFLSPAEMPGATGEAVPVLGKDKKMALSANARRALPRLEQSMRVEEPAAERIL